MILETYFYAWCWNLQGTYTTADAKTDNEKCVLPTQKSSREPSSTADAQIFRAHRLQLAHKLLTKTRSLGPKNHPRSPLLCRMLKTSMDMDYCWLRNRWQKLCSCCPKNNPRNPVLRLTLKSSMDIDYYWLTDHWQKLSPWDARIIQEAHFYGWRWHLQWLTPTSFTHIHYC
jgi:hypothetical protein